jgi:hypothetical protein
MRHRGAEITESAEIAEKDKGKKSVFLDLFVLSALSVPLWRIRRY